jgi:hypothetical protein
MPASPLSSSVGVDNDRLIESRLIAKNFSVSHYGEAMTICGAIPTDHQAVRASRQVWRQRDHVGVGNHFTGDPTVSGPSAMGRFGITLSYKLPRRIHKVHEHGESLDRVHQRLPIEDDLNGPIGLGELDIVT